MRPSYKSVFALVVAAMALTSCSIDDSLPRVSATPTTTPTATETPTYQSSDQQPTIRLTVTTLSRNAADESTHHLVCVRTTAVNGTDLPDADKACSLLDGDPALLQNQPSKNSNECTGMDQPNIADVFGEIDGQQVRTSFLRNNTCNIATWDNLKPLLGTVTSK